MRHSWPGNVRELQNVLFRLALRGEGAVTAAHVRAVLGVGEAPRGSPSILSRIEASGAEGVR